jgi:hypothetical protein
MSDSLPKAMPKSKATNEPYRKVKITLWDDPKFRALSPLPPGGQSLFIYLLTSPFTGIIPGLFKAGRAALAEELGWEQEAFDLALEEGLSLGMVKADLKARVFWLPEAAAHNPPVSVNVIKSWARAFELLPECDLKWEAWNSLQATCYAVSEAMGKAYDMAMPLPEDKAKPLPSRIQKAVNSKQILKPENIMSGAEKTQPRTGEPLPAEAIFISLPLTGGMTYPVTLDYIASRMELYPAVDIRQELRNMCGWLESNPKKRKTPNGIRKFITTWLQRCQDNPRNRQVTHGQTPGNTESIAERQLREGREQYIRERQHHGGHAGMAVVGPHDKNLQQPLDCEEWQSSLGPVGAADWLDDQ